MLPASILKPLMGVVPGQVHDVVVHNAANACHLQSPNSRCYQWASLFRVYGKQQLKLTAQMKAFVHVLIRQASLEWYLIKLYFKPNLSSLPSIVDEYDVVCTCIVSSLVCRVTILPVYCFPAWKWLSEPGIR